MFEPSVVIRVLAILTVTISTQVLTACPPNPALAHSFGDGTFTAGKNIQPGTYRTQNRGPHTVTEKCAWAVRLVNNAGDNADVILASSGDVGETPQQVFIPAGRKISSNHCGVWEKTSSENETD